MGQILTFTNATEYISLVNFMAEVALKAQFLKFSNIDQAKVVAMTAVNRGIDLMDACLPFEILNGRLSKKTIAMLAEYKARGGKYRELRRDSESASIEYTYDGRTTTFTLNWEQIKDEDYTKERDGKTYKPRYKEPHSRMQMLWARLVSDSLGVIAPEVKGGLYTPEETADIADGEFRTVAIATTAQPVANIASTPIASSPAPAASEQVASAAVSESATDAVIMISQEQLKQLSSLFAALDIGQADIDASMANRGLKSVTELTAAQASQIITKLEGMLIASPANTLGDSVLITPDLEASIQDAIKVCAQAEGGMQIVSAVQDHLSKNQIGLRQLTQREGEILLSAVEQRQVKQFLDLALQGGQQVGKA